LKALSSNKWIVFGALIFIAFNFYFTLQNDWWFGLIPFALILIYITIFKMDWALMMVAFLAPLSFNIEEFTDGKFGLFVPTEPILILLLLLIIYTQLRKSYLPKELIKNPIVWAIIFYLFWILMTSITSVLPTVSFKYLLMRLWFFVPLVFFGTYVFLDKKKISIFMWLYIIAMCIVIIYTTINHSLYGFGEKESHWVMFPFFKDHTSYGAMCAFIVPLIIGFYFSKKQTPLIQVVFVIIFAIAMTGLFFSYTRAAWLSIAVAIVVGLIIKLKIRFRYLAIIGAIAGVLILINWTEINHSLDKNKSEHTTENFEKRIQSAANITTDASNLERINRWSCAWAMFLDKPIVGFGPGTYAFEYAPFQLPENKTIISTNFGNLGNAHSEYLGPLAEMGLLGMISFSLIVIAIFYKAVTLYIRYPQGEERTWIFAFILALSTYFVHGFLNDFLDTDKVAVPVWGIVAALIALEINLDRKLKEKN